MTKIVPVVCPGCNTPMHTKDKDTVFLCDRCGTMQARDGVVAIVEYEAGEFRRQMDGEKVYLPFWKLGVNFNVRHSRVEGGSVSRFVGFLKGDSPSGSIDMMLPAFETDPVRYKEIAKKLTLDPPNYARANMDRGIKRMPCTITIDMTDDMADFLFITIEAEKPGVLQSLDYDLKVVSRKLVYLPYYKKGESLEPGY
ncbi:hypothetical protein [Methanooceanicella nereidis]|uniref:hypothetical protein n=1 Tax=Methanooceanicella nereidis TaxID=2052831 RepID=UPI001E4ED98F|nr:hypothetical protein [Methanocella sp. CWC-04]